MAKPRVLAFYLPQFHPIPENDRWWGSGFTEWTNVTKAEPLFAHHWQPHYPADLGYYDLRIPEVREAQAAIAREAGIEGFCYWHYWFGDGRRILERPFAEVVSSGKPDFPFCLAWANQSWTGVWHGNPKETLVQQTYPGRADEAAHFQCILPALRDHRYLKVDGKPIFVVYAPHELPDAKAFVQHFQELAIGAGFPGLYMIAISNSYSAAASEAQREVLNSFDAITQSPPGDFLSSVHIHGRRDLLQLLTSGQLGAFFRALAGGAWKRPRRFAYGEVVQSALADMPDEPRFLPCVIPNWDNTPRSGVRGLVYTDSTPALFSEYLHKAFARASLRDRDHGIVFLKSWNEWAEGNYVEPDTRFGHEYLSAIKSALGRFE